MNSGDSLEKKNFVIIDKHFAPIAAPYALKLDRHGGKLLVYSLMSDAGDGCVKETIDGLYPLRDDFSMDGYLVYTLERQFDCIFGREKTPVGLFMIQKVTNEVTETHYRDGMRLYLQGHLEIFEDYWIHAELLQSCENGDLKPFEMSLQDEVTHGCVRVGKSDLQWLLEHLQEGTVVFL